MDAKFKFALGQKVVMESGIVGVVEGNCVLKEYTANRIYVKYFDKNGARFEQYFDESDLTAV